MALHFDPAADAQRRATAAWLRVILTWDWGRRSGVGRGDQLTCPAGELLQDQIEGRFAAGTPATPIVDQHGTTRYTGRGARWRLLGAVAGLETNPLQDMADRLQLLESPAISGDITGPSWDALYERADYGRMFSSRQSGVIGLQSMAVRPVLAEFRPGVYYPAGLQEVPPDLCFAIRDPSSPGRPAVFGCYMGEGDGQVVTASGGRYTEAGWYVWDFSDPSMPVFGHFDSPEAWYQWHQAGGVFQTGRYGVAPRWVVFGTAYPWTWLGRPFMPVACQQWDARTRELLPARGSDGQAVLDLILQRIWCLHLQQHGSFNRTVFTSDNPLAGFGQMMNEPGALMTLFGSGEKKIDTIPHFMDAAVAAWDLHRQRLLEWAQRYDPAFEIQASKSSPESGDALRIRSSSRHRLRQRQMNAARKIDTLCAQLLVSTSNFLARCGCMGEAWRSEIGIIPEGAINLRYAHTMDAIEAEEREKALVIAVDRGEEFAESLHLLRRGMDEVDRGSAEWAAAAEYIDASTDAALRRAARGYGMKWEARYALTTKTVEDEAEMFIPPGDVADEAGRGLTIREDKGVGLPRWQNPRGESLYKRAVRIQNQQPMDRGEVRALNLWLKQHTDDGTADPGGWNNPSAPSAAWVEYLSQGGDPGLAWTGTVLMGGSDGTGLDADPGGQQGALEGGGDGGDAGGERAPDVGV